MILALLLAAAPVVGVLEFRDEVPADPRIDAAHLSDRVRAAVKETLPEARVIAREEMLVLLKEPGKALEGCQGDCEVEAGRRIGADLVVSGELLRSDSQYKLNLKLHDTRSAELLSGSAGSGASPDDLDRDLRASVRRLFAPLFQNRLSDQRQVAKETIVQQVRPLPGVAAALWVVAGYDWTSNAATPTSFPVGGGPAITFPGPRSAFGADVGGELFFRIVGPIYLGGIVDYGLTGPSALLVAGGARLAIAALSLSGGVGYSGYAEGGLGAIVGADFTVTSAFALRVQGTWRHSTFNVDFPQPTEYRRTVWSLMGGLSLHL
jgi:hypothetical protein